MGYEAFQQLKPSDFDTHTFESETPAMVFFAAERCHVCKELLPRVEELVVEYAGKLNVYSVDVDQYPGLDKRFSLRGIPQMLIFNEKEVKNRIDGLHEKEDIIEVIDSIIS